MEEEDEEEEEEEEDDEEGALLNISSRDEEAYTTSLAPTGFLKLLYRKKDCKNDDKIS